MPDLSNLQALPRSQLELIIGAGHVPADVRAAADALLVDNLVTDTEALLAAMGSGSPGLRQATDNLKTLKTFLNQNPLGDLGDRVTRMVKELTGAKADDPAAAPAPFGDQDEEDAQERASPGTEHTSITVEEMIGEILRREGGFVNDPDDSGGATNMGITQATLAKARDHAVTVDDVRNLTEAEARQIYRARYFERPKIGRLPDLLQPGIFDMAVNHGAGGAIKMLQEVLTRKGFVCSIDGGIGDETVGCADTAAAQLGDGLVNAIVDRRVSFYHSLVARKPSQQKFLKGWLRRANEFRVT